MRTESVIAAALCAVVGLVQSIPAMAADYDLTPVPEFAAAVAKHDVGACSAVAVNRKQEVILFHRGKRPVMFLDADGGLIRAWGHDLIRAPHGLRVDAADNLWVTDTGTHRVAKFSPEGKLLIALGTGTAGGASDEFNKPTDIAFGENGDVYVTDGYGNNRVQKFSKDGKLLHSWGRRGTNDAEFHLPHAVLIDRRGRVIVGDRENDRIQLFDADGRFLEVWKGFAPYGLAFDPDGAVFVADARASRILKLDGAGKVVRTWGEKGAAPGQFETPHMLAFDAKGDLYVAEVGGRRLQKLARP